MRLLWLKFCHCAVRVYTNLIRHINGIQVAASGGSELVTSPEQLLYCTSRGELLLSICNKIFKCQRLSSQATSQVYHMV